LAQDARIVNAAREPIRRSLFLSQTRPKAAHPGIEPDNSALLGKNIFVNANRFTAASFFRKENHMAISKTEIQAAVEDACQMFKGAITNCQQMIRSLEAQILRSQETLNALQAQPNPDQDAIDQIKQIIAALQDQLSDQQNALTGAENDYEIHCTPQPTTPTR
jgi:septal ring factor EnvC (AmiA/AmiB activator)